MLRVRTLGLVAALALPLAVGVRSAQATDLSVFTIVGLAAGKTGDKIEVMFNPKEYTITKATPWKHHDIQGLDAPTLEFTSGEPYRCQFELFFDRYEEGKSVREFTDKIEKLAVVEEGQSLPPVVHVTWGGSDWTTRLLQARTRILDVAPDGTPLAAVVETLWSAFVPPAPPSPIPLPYPLVMSTKGGKVEAKLDGGSIELLTLKNKDVVKAQPIAVHAVQGLSPHVDIRAGDGQRLRFEMEIDGAGKDVAQLLRRVLAETSAELLLNAKPDGTGGHAFKCILESFSLRFTLFLDDGTPVRAVMNTTWKEFSPAEDQLKGNPRH